MRDRSVWDVIRADRWLLDAMLSPFPDGSINVLDRDYRNLFLAGSALDRLEVPPSVLVGMHIDDLVPAVDADRIKPFYERAFSGETVTFTTPICGREHRIRAAPLAEQDGTVNAIVAIAQEAPAPEPSSEQLTPRQRQIVALIADGLTNKEIARRLGIGATSVRNQVTATLKRLNLASRTQLGVWAATRGLYRSDNDGTRESGS